MAEGVDTSVAPESSVGTSSDQKPVCLIVLGMAGSGKRLLYSVSRLTYTQENPICDKSRSCSS
uniref:Uncharacterized protein n=1 Tax=Anguilla anguilla TaxID=7936 RepID=A0A0E9UXQ2_ANGAN